MALFALVWLSNFRKSLLFPCSELKRPKGGNIFDNGNGSSKPFRKFCNSMYMPNYTVSYASILRYKENKNLASREVYRLTITQRDNGKQNPKFRGEPKV